MHREIIKKFINRLKIKHPNDKIEVNGILGFGSSFNKKKLNPNSDMDIYLVIKNIGKRYRGIMLVNGVEVDYFVNPIKQLKADWRKVKNKFTTRKTAAYMLRDGEIILDQNNELKKLKEEARKFLEKDLEYGRMSSSTLVTSKYFINDYLGDIEDSIRGGDAFSFQYNISSLLNYLIEVFCQFHKIPLVKQKYQGTEIAKRDKKFVELYESVSEAFSKGEKFNRIKNLVSYSLESLGGKLPKEWELESSIL